MTLAAGSPAKRAARGEGVGARVKRVVQALLDEELPSEVPLASREMLALGAPSALASVVEERHKMQASVCEHIGEVFGDILAHLQARADKAKAGAADRNVELEALVAAAAAAQGALSEAESAVNEQQAKLAEQRTAVAAEEENVRGSQRSQQALVHARAAAEKERARRADIEEGLQKLLAGEDFEPKTAKKECARLVKMLERLEAESALLAAMPEVLTKPPTERNGFDLMVVEAVDSFMKGLLATVDGELAEGAGKLAEAEAELAGNEVVREKAATELEAEHTKLTELQVVLDEKQAAKDAADEKVAELKSASSELDDNVAQADDEVATFTDVLQTLTGLLERSSAPPPEEKDAAPDAAEPEAPVAVE